LKHQTAKKGRLLTNLVWNFTDFVTAVAAGLWFTPYLIRSLGADVFGLVPLATQIIGYLAVVTIGLNAAVGRNLTIAFEKGQHEKANRIFNTSLWGGIVLSTVLLSAGGVASWYGQYLVKTPVGYEMIVRWLLGAALVSFVLGIISTPFGIASYALNRFDISNAISIIQRVFTIAFVVILFSCTKPSLAIVAGSMVLGGMLTFTQKFIAQKRIMPFLRVNRRDFDFQEFRELFSFGGWMIINWLGGILFLSIDLLVVNRMFGPVAGGNFAVAAQWSNLLRSMGVVVVGVFGPTFLYYYARKDLANLVVYGQRTVRLVGLGLALPIGLICGLSHPLLCAWVGKEYAWLAGLVSLLTGPLCVNLPVTSLLNIQNATGRVRLPGILTCVLGLMNLGLAILLAGPGELGIYGVALASCIMLTSRTLFTPFYCAWILELPFRTFFREILTVVLATGAIALTSFTASWWIDFSSWGRLFGAGVVVGTIYAGLAWLFLLNRQERALVLAKLRIPRAAFDSASLPETTDVLE
jgi:membrane protein EpsK